MRSRLRGAVSILFAHFPLEMLRKGSRRRPATAIASSLDHLPAWLDLSADHDSVSVGVQSLSSVAPAAVRLVREILSSPAFPAVEIERHRTELRGHLLQEKEQPDAVPDRALDEQVFGDHPYGVSPEGTLRTIRKIRRPGILRHHRSLFSPEGCLIAVLGDATPAEAPRLAECGFGGLSARPAPVSPPPVAPGPDKPRILLL